MHDRTVVLLILANVLALGLPGCKKDDQRGSNPVTPTEPGQLLIRAGDFLPNDASCVYWQGLFHPGSIPYDAALADTAYTGSEMAWSFGMPGAEQTDIDSLRYDAPSRSPRGGMFPAATRAITWDRYGYYDYYRVANDGYYWLGWAYEMTDTCRLDPPMQLLKLPMTMGTSWVAVNRQCFVYEDGDVICWVDSLFSLVDGWGTVTWPFGADTCLRVTGEHRAWWVYHGYALRDITGTESAWIDAHGETLVDVADITDSHAVRSIYVAMRIDDPPAAVLAAAPVDQRISGPAFPRVRPAAPPPRTSFLPTAR